MFERIAPDQHDALDGIPEPSENPALFGHVEAKAMLAGALLAGKLPHGLIFAGPPGVGKATLAFHLANRLLRSPDSTSAAADIGQPDPASSVFRHISRGAHPSVLHLTRPYDEKNKRFKTVISVDEVRKVNRFLGLTAHDGGWRVVIVDPADDMNANAANAILKNLEEPPAKTVFVLIAHSPGALLPTIRSRAQMIRFAPLSAADLNAALATFDINAGEGINPDILAQRAGGSVRMAILLTQYGGLEIADAVDRLADAAAIDVSLAHKLADAVSGRARAIPFEMFNERALEILSDAAAGAAADGDLQKANRLATAWQEARNAISEAETYNLDAKLHALILIDRLNTALRTTPGPM